MLAADAASMHPKKNVLIALFLFLKSFLINYKTDLKNLVITKKRLNSDQISYFAVDCSIIVINLS